ncbi:MAG: pyrroline-5-carboxylate reductase dimerization domain-containing protein, partial [Dehalococcoidia bacterium]
VILHACGQLYLYPVIKAMIGFGEENGFSRGQAQAIVLSTLRSTAQALSGVECSPEWMDDRMAHASLPGSLTGAGLGVLKEQDVEGVYGRVGLAALEQARRHRAS